MMGVKPAELEGDFNLVEPTPELGPARQALIAHESETRKLARASHDNVITPPRDVFAFRVRSDGTVAIALNVTLPLAKGVALAQSLMTMGVMMTPDPPQEEPDEP
jgi:hypothetical protein